MAKTKFIAELNVDYTLALGVANSSLALYPAGAATGACTRAITVSGLRWNITHNTADGSTNMHKGKWIIWIRRGAGALPSLAFPASNATLQQSFAGVNPNDILVWGTGMACDGGNLPSWYQGATKTQRKMNEGDGLVFSYAVSSAGAAELGTMLVSVQTFLKS